MKIIFKIIIIFMSLFTPLLFFLYLSIGRELIGKHYIPGTNTILFTYPQYMIYYIIESFLPLSIGSFIIFFVTKITKIAIKIVLILLTTTLLYLYTIFVFYVNLGSTMIEFLGTTWNGIETLQIFLLPNIHYFVSAVLISVILLSIKTIKSAILILEISH